MMRAVSVAWGEKTTGVSSTGNQRRRTVDSG